MNPIQSRSSIANSYFFTEAALVLIKFYRRHLSHLKRGKCAYSIYYGGSTCSAYGLEIFSSNNFSSSILLLRARFIECGIAGNALARSFHTEACTPGLTCMCCVWWSLYELGRKDQRELG